MLAEIIAHFLPRYVSLNTFGHVHSFALKRYNWETLQKVVLRHLNIQLSASQINQLANSEEGAIESLIWLVRQRIEEALEKRRFRPTSGATSSQISRRSSRGCIQKNIFCLKLCYDEFIFRREYNIS